MTGDKQSKIDDILDNGSKWQRTLIKVLVISLIVVLFFAGGLLALLQINTFDTPQNKVSAGDFYKKMAGNITYGQNGFTVYVPEEVICDTAGKYIVSNLPEGRVPTGMAYDAQYSRLNLNLSAFGFYLPISYELQFEQLDNGIAISYSDLRLGKGLWSLSDGMKVFVLAMAGLDLPDEKQVISFSDYGLNPSINFESMMEVDGLPLISFRADEARIRDELTKVKEGVTPRLLAYYETFDRERVAPVLLMLDNGFASDAKVRDLINSLRGDKYLVSDLLLIAENYDESGLENLLDEYNMFLDIDQIINERKAFKGHAIDGEIGQVFIALDSHFEEKMMAFNQGKPFDIETMTTMTVENLAKAYDLEIDEALLSQLTFIYDSAFKVAYELDKDTYYIRGIDGYEVVSKEIYENYLGSGTFLESSVVKDPLLWDAVVAAIAAYMTTEDLFVRYMVSDGESTFAVISPQESPQEYYGMALMAESGLHRVIEGRVLTVASLIENHPEFNVATATRAIETSDFKRIGDDIYDLIIDELYGQRKITSKRDTSIVYSAYDGKKYIAFKLSNGDEYVYKVQNTVYGTYLADLYTKEKAKRNWSDIPELLMLMDRPE